MDKFIKWIESHTKNIIIGILVLLVAAVLVKDKIDFNKPIAKVESVKITETVPVEVKEKLEPKVLEVKEPEKEAVCSPQEAKFLLSDQTIAKDMNLFIADLKYYDVVETKVVTAYFTKEKLFGVNRSLVMKTKGKSQFYVTIYEPLDKLNYNRQAFDDLGTNYKKPEL